MKFIWSARTAADSPVSIRRKPGVAFAVLSFLVFSLGMTGCGNKEETGESTGADTVAVQPSVEAMDKWARSCVLCHVNGEGGAPRMGQADEWEDRLEQEESVLLDHMVQGYNNMPPLGYCMDCTESDFLVLTKFMAGEQ